LRKVPHVLTALTFAVGLLAGSAFAGQAQTSDACPPGATSVDYCETGTTEYEVQNFPEPGEAQDGGAGNDTQSGGGGSDTQSGGGGSDTQSGGAGNDVQRGGNGDDAQYGGPGNDTQRGGPGDDIQYGGAGNDRMKGDAGDDVQFGGPGNDVVDGGTGSDTSWGGDGNDVMIGGTGADTINGDGASPSGASRAVAAKTKPGTDTIYAQDGKRDEVNCGGKKDKVFADRVDRLQGCETVVYKKSAVPKKFT
jgi:Ca2+-binding RTX toxin-like protein